MKFVIGVLQIEAAICSPAAAVPASAKIPVPIIAPMPMQVRANGPRARFICRSGAAASAIKWSGLFFRKSDIGAESCHHCLRQAIQTFHVGRARLRRADKVNKLDGSAERRP